jgi:cell division protein ZipA
MAELRWVLLLAALLVLVAVFVWTRYRIRLPDRLKLSFRGSEAGASVAHKVHQDPLLSPSTGAPALPAKIVTIRILSRGATPFAAERLVLALREAGLRHGRYGIFHFCSSDTDETPIYSAASLTEPGSFDLTRLRTDVYPGISLFMGLPGPVDGAAAFDAMVKAARAIAKDLEGNLVDELGSTFSIQRERYLREEIIQFQHRQGRPA